jgi:hypothetical protein
MRLDSANRSFLALMGLALLLGMYVLCGAVGSVLVPLILARISHDGIAGLLDSGGAMLPVLLFIALVAVGLAFGARSIVRQMVASSRLARRARGLALELPDELALTASGVGLGGRVVLLDAPEWFSFTYGGNGVRAPSSSRCAAKGGSWPGLERAGWRRRDRWPRPAGCSRRPARDGGAAKVRHGQHHSRRDLACGCGPVCRHVPRVGVELRRSGGCVSGDRHRAQHRRSTRRPDLCRSFRVRRAGRLLADRSACEPATHHESRALMSGLLMVLCPLGMVAMGGVAWVLTRLPGAHTGRIARLARRSTCLPLPASQAQPAQHDSQEKDAITDA